MPSPSHNVAPQTDVALHDARAEAASLRADLATARIATAKKDAELHDLRQQVAELEHAIVELRRTAESRDTELAALQRERDRLLQAGGDRQPVAELSAAPSDTAQSGSVQAKLQELQAAVAALSGGLAQVKQNLAQSQPAVQRSSTNESHAVPAEPTVRALSVTVGLEQPGWVTVRTGDSLWTIARQYGVSVEALKEVNGLPGGHIRAGQRLLIPPRGEDKGEEKLRKPPQPSLLPIRGEGRDEGRPR